MRRRDFLRVAGGAALTGPTISLAEPVKRVRQIGVLTSFGEGDKSGQSWLVAFRQKLLELGWVLARDYNVEYRFTAGDTNRMRTYAGELAALKPDVILVAGTGVVGTARSLLTSLPVVFVQVTDPVGTGFVGSLAHPGGNMTGFTSFEYSMGGKWLELLKEVQPAVSQVSVIENPDNANHIGYLSSIEDAASAMHVRVISAGVRDPTEIEGAFKKIVGEGIGIIVPPDPFTLSLRGAIVALASRYRIPS